MGGPVTLALFQFALAIWCLRMIWLVLTYRESPDERRRRRLGLK